MTTELSGFFFLPLFLSLNFFAKIFDGDVFEVRECETKDTRTHALLHALLHLLLLATS